MLKVKTKDELVIKLELEMRMKEYYWKKFKIGKLEDTEENKQLYDECKGRVDSLRFALGFNELSKGEKHEDK
tara:strand:- start:21273 stop:21488 length:216 start_codon:yes stop_codon:yes gene_type:complete